MIKLFGDTPQYKTSDDSKDDLLPMFECCLLGASSSCKTTLLACVDRLFLQLTCETDMSVGAVHATPSLLSNVFDELERAADTSLPGKFRARIAGTKKKTKWDYFLINGSIMVDFRIHDCPGSWLVTSQSRGNLDAVIEMAQRSSVIIVTISAPLLMETEGARSNGVLASTVNYVMDKAFANDDGREHLILLVPTKCETYMQDAKLRARLHRRVEDEFSATIRLGEAPAYRGRLTVAYLPVQTVGNVRFKEFWEGEEIYLKNVKRSFSPENVDHLAYWLLAFLMRQYALIDTSLDVEDVNSLFTDLAGGGNSVHCGKELLGL